MNKQFAIIAISLFCCISLLADSLADFRVRNRLETLNYLGNTYGIESKSYLDALHDISVELSDTACAKYYVELSDYLIKGHTNALRTYGIDSRNYQEYIWGLNRMYPFNRFFNAKDTIWEMKVAGTLKTLGKGLKKSGPNYSEFLCVLIGVYEREGNYKKALNLGNQRISYLTQNHLEHTDDYYYQLTNNLRAYARLSDWDGYENFFKTHINEATLKQMSDIGVISSLIMDLPSDINSDTEKLLLSLLAQAGGSYKDLSLQYQILAQAGNIQALTEVESFVKSNCNWSELHEFYSSSSNHLAHIANLYKPAIDYKIKAIKIAESNNRRELNYNPIGENFHFWESVALYAEKLNDKALAESAYTNALSAIELDYGRNSTRWLKAKEFQSVQIDLFFRDAFAEVKCLEEMIEPSIVVYGENSNELNRLYLKLAATWRQASNTDHAQTYLQKIDINNVESSQIKFQYYNESGLQLRQRHMDSEALKMFELALNNAESSDDKSTVMFNMAGLSDNLDAATRERELLSLLETEDKTNISRILSLYDDLGELTSHNDCRKALSYFIKGDMYVTDAKIQPFARIEHFRRKAMAYDNNSYEYLANIQKALDEFSESGYRDDALKGVLYRDMGDYYDRILDYGKALDAYTTALGLLENLPPEDNRLLTLLNNTAITFASIGDYDKAIRINKMVSLVRLMELGPENEDYQTSVGNLLHNFIEIKDIEHADSTMTEFQSALMISPTPAKIAKISLYQANLNIIKEEYSDAEENFLLAAKNDPSLTKTVYRNLEDLYLSIGNVKYINCLKRNLNDYKDLILQNHLYLSSNERQNQVFFVDNIRSHAICGIDKFPSITPAVYDFTLFSKGLLFYTSKEIDRLIVGNKRAYERFGSLKSKRQTRDLAIAQGDSAIVAALGSEIEGLERDLVNEFVPFSKLSKSLNISVNDVLKCIGKNALAIDFVRYKENESVRYGAFVLSEKRKTPVFITICSESDIKSLFPAKDRYGSYGDAFYAIYADKKLYDLIWSKLIPYMDGYEDIYFSADGLLHQLAIEYTYNPKNKLLNTDYRLHRVYHLAHINEVPNLGANLLFAGVSDYSSAVSTASEQSAERSVTRGRYQHNLDNVAIECKAVGSQWSTIPRSKYDTLLDDKVTESTIKSLSGSDISTLHIASHGIFLSKENLERAIESEMYEAALAQRTFMSGQESLSALLLSNANKYWSTPFVAAGEEDDILTSQEIENLSFPNLNLTVLSACETGLGDVDLDGVWGLQRAFRIAGSKNLICSLCKVDDKATSEFMTHFYEGMAQGQSVFEAFRNAQHQLYEDNKFEGHNVSKRQKAAKIWSSMILIE